MMNSQRSDTEKTNQIEDGKKQTSVRLLNTTKLLMKVQNLKYKAMSSYKCRKNTESINPRVSKNNNGKTIILSKYAICGSKKSRFI